MGALASIGLWLADKVSGKALDNLLDKYSIGTKEIDELFYKKVEIVSKEMEKKFPGNLGNEVKYFFSQEEVYSELLKLLFKKSKLNINKIEENFATENLPKDYILNFVKLLKIELAKEKIFDEIFADQEIYENITSINTKIDTISKGMESINTILRNSYGVDFNFQSFKEAYYKKALNTLSQVNFLGLGVDSSIRRKDKKLMDIFIKPLFSIPIQIAPHYNFVTVQPEGLKIDDTVGYFEASSLFNSKSNLVILGKPGSGKSLIIKYIICSLVSNDRSEFSEESVYSRIPFRIELRKYLAFKKEKRSNLIDFLSVQLSEDFGFNCSINILETILLNKDGLLLFDGLDEIFKIEDKISIRNDIENFHISYPKCLSITTSRIIGYDEAKLNSDSFLEVYVQDFTETQVDDYVKKWYSQEVEHEETRNSEVEGFISRKLEIHHELRRNPLLLSLIVILYRNTLRIPESKLEIYQSCTKTLVEKWDASKELKIDIDEKLLREKEKILANLAHWQYLQLSSSVAEISYEKVKAEIANVLLNKIKVADEFNMLDKAEEFLSYAQKRSLYFDNNFTHKTFLEYYTAYWIYSNVEKKHKTAERDDILFNYADNSFWHTVLELLLNMIDKDQPDTEILDSIFEKLISQSKGYYLLLTTTNKFRNIGEQSIRLLVSSALKEVLLIDEIDEKIRKTYEGLGGLYSSDPDEFRTLYTDSLIEISEMKPFNLNLFHFACEFDMVLDNEERLNYKIEIEDFQEMIKSKKELFILSLETERNPNKNNFDNLIEFVNLFGLESIFYESPMLFEEFEMYSVFMHYYLWQFNDQNIGTFPENFSKIVAHGIDPSKCLAYLIDSKYAFLDTSLEGVREIITLTNVCNIKYQKGILVLTLAFIVEYTHFVNENGSIELENLISNRDDSILVEFSKLKDWQSQIDFIRSQFMDF